MDDGKKIDLEYLIRLTEKKIPDFIRELSSSELDKMREYVQNVIDYATFGLDELYQSISMTIKFVPNFILIPITKKFIKPPIAAGVTGKLDLKSAVGLANGLPIEYLGEVALYTESKLSAAIVSKISKIKAEKCIEYEALNHPVKALEVGQYLDDSLLKVAARHLDLLEAVDPVMLEKYKDLIERVRKLV